VYEVSADTVIINILFCSRNDVVDFHLPACSGLEFDRAVVATLPRLIIAVSTTDVRHLDSLCPVRVIVRVGRETIGNGASVWVRPVDCHIIACLVSTMGGMSSNVI
jgi:hypothetical protein